MDSESSSLAPRRRPVRAILAALAVAALSAGFTACDDDDVDNAQDQVDSVQSQLDEATESIQSQADSVQSEAEDLTESVQSEAEDKKGN